MQSVAIDIARNVVYVSVSMVHMGELNRSRCHLGCWLMDPRNHVLHGVQKPQGKGQLWGGMW